METQTQPAAPSRSKKLLAIPAAALLLACLGSVSFFAHRRITRASAEDSEIRTVIHLEVCNMIAGNFKAKLAGMGNHCMLSVPTIITGGDYHMHSLADGGTVEIALEFETSLLWITLELHS